MCGLQKCVGVQDVALVRRLRELCGCMDACILLWTSGGISPAVDEVYASVLRVL